MTDMTLNCPVCNNPIKMPVTNRTDPDGQPYAEINPAFIKQHLHSAHTPGEEPTHEHDS